MAHKERACHPPPAPFLGPSSSPGRGHGATLHNSRRLVQAVGAAFST